MHNHHSLVRTDPRRRAGGCSYWNLFSLFDICFTLPITLTKTPHKKIPINAREILIGTLTDLGWGWICTWIFCLFCFDGFSESSDSLRGCYFRALLFPIATFSLSIRTNSVRVTRDSLVTAAAHTEKTRRRRNCTRQKLCQSPEIPNPFFTNAPRQDSLFCAY